MDHPVLLAAAHGSLAPDGSAAARRVVERVRTIRPDVEIRLAFVDDEEPLVAAALDQLGSEGRDVIVVPLLLHTGAHVKRDLPGAVDATRQAHPGLQAVVTPPLGPGSRLARAGRERLAQAGVRDDDPAWSIVVAGAGTADPDGATDFARTTRLIGEGTAWARTDPAFAIGGAHPTVAAALTALHAAGATTAAVLPFVLGSGYFATVVERAVEESPFASGSVVVAAPLGDHPEIAHTLVERYDDALAATRKADPLAPEPFAGQA